MNGLDLADINENSENFNENDNKQNNRKNIGIDSGNEVNTKIVELSQKSIGDKSTIFNVLNLPELN